jgi:hypothetical protein
VSATPGRSGQVARRGAARDVAARRRRGRPSEECPPVVVRWRRSRSAFRVRSEPAPSRAARGRAAGRPPFSGQPCPRVHPAARRAVRVGARGPLCCVPEHRRPCAPVRAVRHVCSPRHGGLQGFRPMSFAVHRRPQVHPQAAPRDCHAAHSPVDQFCGQSARPTPPVQRRSAESAHACVRPRTSTWASPPASAARRGRGLARRTRRRRRASRRADPAASPRGARRGPARASAR